MTEESEVVKVVREYRKELNRNESVALSAMSKAWVRVESEIKNEMLELAREITERQEQGLPVYDQYIHTSKRYISLLQQTQAELDWYNNKVIDVVSRYQRDNINLGLDAANEAILQSYDVASPSWTKLNISGFENMIGMLSDGSPLNRLLKKDYPLAIEGINQALSNGIAIGKGYKQIATDMAEASRMAYERSVLIARTEINRAYRLANTEQYRASGVVTGFRRLVYKPTACFACLMMDGDFYSVGQELCDHPRGKCVLPGQLVSGPVPVAFISRHYDGDVVIINTASGKLLSVTPNHPILTDRGWIAAEFIKEGTNVVCDSGNDWAASGMSPNEYQIPTLIENIPSTLNMSRLTSVPGTAKDFHGDGIDGEVSVIWANRFLRDRIKADIFEQRSQINFRFGNISLLLLNSEGTFTEKLKRLRSTFTPLMHGRSIRFDFFGSHSFDPKFRGIRRCPTSNPGFSQTHRDYISGNIKSFCDRLFAFAGLISTDYLIRGDVTVSYGKSSNFFPTDSVPFGFGSEQPIGLEVIRKALGLKVPSGGGDVRTIASNVIFDSVIKIERTRFSGHVYNLQTQEQWYITNGIVTHNCTSVPETIGGNSPQWQKGSDWFLEQSAEDQRRIMGNARFEAWKSGEVKDLQSMVYMKPNVVWGPAPTIKNLDELSIHTIRSFAGQGYFYVPETLSEYFAEEYGDDAYKEAAGGGKFSGAYEKFNEQSNKSLNKTIKSLENRVAEHVEKIMSPEKYYTDWDKQDETTKKGIINDWESHLEKNKKSLEIAKRVRAEREDKSSD